MTYGLLSLLGLLALTTCAAIFLRWPLGVKLGCVLLCLVIAAGAVAFVVLTAGLKIGSDACANVEAFVLTQLDDGNAQLVARYWLYGEGSLDAVTGVVFDVDLDVTASEVEASRASVLQALADLTLRQGLQTQVNATLATVDDIVAGIDDLSAALAYTSVHPGAWVAVRGRDSHATACPLRGGGGGRRRGAGLEHLAQPPIPRALQCTCPSSRLRAARP